MSRTLVVVAHADDETLWCGGWLLENPGTDVCCCSIPRNDPQRILDFFIACQALRAKGFVVGENENQGLKETRVVQAVAASYDEIITHNELGEYGHPMHIRLHYAMKELKQPMRVFNYGIRPGMPINYELKVAALRRYSTRPDVLKNQSRNFDLSKEVLIRVSHA